MSKWIENAGARAHVEALLAKAGVPLELEVASVAQAVVEEFLGDESVKASSEALVYESPDDLGTYREVDRRFSLYQEFELDEHTGVQLIISVPIECKSREEMELFLFPSDRERVTRRFPLYGDFIGSRLGRRLRSTFATLQHHTLGSFVSLRIHDGSTPQAVEKEELIYKAGGSLYDFVAADARTHASSPREAEVLEELGIWEDFLAFRRSKHWLWEFALPAFVKTLTAEQTGAFQEGYSGSGRMYYGLHGAIPVVCVDSPIYEVAWKTSESATGFTETNGGVGAMRKQRWPGECGPYLLETGPEVPVIVTNPAHLAEVLYEADGWRKAIVAVLAGAPAEEKTSWALEAALYRVAIIHFAESQGWYYRSDLELAGIV